MPLRECFRTCFPLPDPGLLRPFTYTVTESLDNPCPTFRKIQQRLPTGWREADYGGSFPQGPSLVFSSDKPSACALPSVPGNYWIQCIRADVVHCGYPGAEISFAEVQPLSNSPCDERLG